MYEKYDKDYFNSKLWGEQTMVLQINTKWNKNDKSTMNKKIKNCHFLLDNRSWC